MVEISYPKSIMGWTVIGKQLSVSGWLQYWILNTY